MASSDLRDFVPQVHGYFEQDDVMGEPMSMLLMDRIAFTFAHLIEKMMAGPLSELTINVMVTCVLNVVRRIAQAAQRGIMTHDWHVGNIAFHDESGASAMVLVDFEKNNPAAPSTTYKERMDATMKPFWAYLPGPIAWGDTDRISTMSESQQTVILAWRRAMKSIAQALEHWWRAWCRAHLRGDELPSDSDWDSLDHNLHVVAAESCAQQHVIASSIPSFDEDVPMEPSIIASTIVSPSFVTRVPTISSASIASRGPITLQQIRTAEDNTEAAQLLQGLVPVPHSAGHEIVLAEDNTGAEQIMHALVPEPHAARAGGDAVRGLLIMAAAGQRKHKFLASRLQTDNSKSLQERQRIHELEGAPAKPGGEGFQHHIPTQTTDEFNDLHVLFRVLSQALKKPRQVDGGKGWLQRMPIPPKTATDLAEFHSKHAKPFGKACDPPWLRMTVPQKCKRLHDFLFTKFSMDKQNQCMMPDYHKRKKRRNDAGWNGFWLRDTELTILVNETMEEYAVTKQKTMQTQHDRDQMQLGRSPAANSEPMSSRPRVEGFIPCEEINNRWDNAAIIREQESEAEKMREDLEIQSVIASTIMMPEAMMAIARIFALVTIRSGVQLPNDRLETNRRLQSDEKEFLAKIQNMRSYECPWDYIADCNKHFRKPEHADLWIQWILYARHILEPNTIPVWNDPEQESSSRLAAHRRDQIEAQDHSQRIMRLAQQEEFQQMARSRPQAEVPVRTPDRQ